MKKLLLILLCLPLLFGCSNQQHKEYKDISSDNTQILEDDNDLLEQLDEEKEDPIDVFRNPKDEFQKFYYPTGELQFQGNYDSANLRQGFWREYFKNGKIKAEGSVLDGKETGLWKFYYEDGRIEREVEISYGNNGYVKRYFRNGNISFEGNMKDGVDDGFCKVYHENGQLKAAGNIKNGKAVGSFKLYSEDGQFFKEKIY